MIARVFDGADRGPDARRRARQHHDHLADQHGDLRGAALLGSDAAHLVGLRHRTNNARFFEPIGVKVPIAVSAFPDELYPGAAKLGGAGLSAS